MLFENEKEVREFAKVLARKMLDRRPLSEWRKLAKVITDSPTAGLSDLYAALLGYNRDPIPSSAYREALNKMHFAVNGIKPYADGGEDEEDPQPCSAHSCNGTYDAAAYGERGEYEVCNGDQNAGYSSLRPCPVLTEPWSCSGVFKCVANFNCANNIFTCARVFWQNDQGCPGGDVYRCGTTQDHKTHACNEKTATFRCKKGDLGGEDDYDFLNTYACSESYTKCENWANFACDGQRFLCQLDHRCGMRVRMRTMIP